MIFSAIIPLDDVDVEIMGKYSGLSIRDGEAHVRFIHPHEENPGYVDSIVFGGEIVITIDDARDPIKHPVVSAMWASALAYIEDTADEMAERGSDTW